MNLISLSATGSGITCIQIHDSIKYPARNFPQEKNNRVYSKTAVPKSR